MYTNKKGVSNAVIGVLIVVALIIVIAGTVVILDGTQRANQKAAPVSTVETSSGLIQLEIAGPKYKHSGAAGMITLNVQ
jgi:urocanate hydratase